MTLRKLLAAGGLAFGLSGLGLFGGIGHALADASNYEDSGTYDEMVEVHGDSGSVTVMQDDDGIQADDVVSSTAWTPGSVTGH